MHVVLCLGSYTTRCYAGESSLQMKLFEISSPTIRSQGDLWMNTSLSTPLSKNQWYREIDECPPDFRTASIWQCKTCWDEEQVYRTPEACDVGCCGYIDFSSETHEVVLECRDRCCYRIIVKYEGGKRSFFFLFNDVSTDGPPQGGVCSNMSLEGSSDCSFRCAFERIGPDGKEESVPCPYGKFSISGEPLTSEEKVECLERPPAIPIRRLVIIGTVAGLVVVLVVIGFGTWACVRRRSQREEYSAD